MNRKHALEDDEVEDLLEGRGRADGSGHVRDRGSPPAMIYVIFGLAAVVSLAVLCGVSRGAMARDADGGTTTAEKSSSSATSSSRRPCNVIGVSNFQKPSLSFQRRQNNSNVSSVAMEVYLLGRFGNNLFQYAAAVSEGIERGIPLQHKHSSQLPHIAEIMIGDDKSSETGEAETNVSFVRPGPDGSPYYQTAFWVNTFAKHRSDLCYFLAMPLQQQQKQLPKPNDVVIHFRDFDMSRRRRMQRRRQLRVPQLFNVYKGQFRITIPPTIYYDRILEDGNYDTIWLVAEPSIRRHPIVRHILSKFRSTAVIRKGGTPDEDFQFISFASNIILSPSTFGWWAAFFAAGNSNDGPPVTIHYPIMPMPVPMEWCYLVGGFRGSSSATMVFHDWFGNTFTNDPDEAWQICDMYDEKPPTLQSVAAHYPELDPTTTPKEQTKRSRRPWWQWRPR
jgi:hypothetical protein